MADRQKSHFGSDGYKDLEAREELNKRTNSPSKLNKKLKAKADEVKKYRKENAKLKGY